MENKLFRFPQRLKELRECAGLSRRTLSELCGLSKDMVLLYERGERLPTLKNVMLISSFFGISIDYLCGVTDEVGGIRCVQKKQ